jgi:glycerol-3-phosphate dehydrogenase (NAD(P)+)
VSLAVLGGGSWGTALAAHLRRAGHPTRLWLRDAGVAEEINRRRRNPAYLPGIELPPELKATTDLAEAVSSAEAIFVVIPSEFCRGVYRQLPAHARPEAVIVSATKGLEIDTRRRMSEVAAEEAPGHPLAVLSGPSFALEVAREQPTTVVVASLELPVAEEVQRLVSTRAFRAYSSDDVVGVELAGSLKNVIAIAAGIVDGLGYGHNTVAALVTRGLAEIARWRTARGRTLFRASPASATSSSPARAPCPGTAASARPSARDGGWRRRSRRRAWSRRASGPPSPRARWPSARASRCPSPCRCGRSSTGAVRRARRSRRSCSAR